MVRKDIKSKIKEYFLLNPQLKLWVRQIERDLKIPLPSIICYTKELERENILQSTEAGMRIYSADRASPTFILEKKLYNLRSLFSSGLVDFLVQELSNPTMIIFGSYARGEDVENSDIDLYVESVKKYFPSLAKFEKKLQRKIQIFKYKDISQVENKELANNIINGITLNGFVEVFR
ncbi:MAG: nucleotidyltransferase domain-containing protein [Nanoarchaeota archaeon]